MVVGDLLSRTVMALKAAITGHVPKKRQGCRGESTAACVPSSDLYFGIQPI
jgi:hypothetical protein